MYVTNTTYAYLSMRNGDQFAKKFGGTDGNDPDWLKLTITGIDKDNNPTEQVVFFLADFRFSDNSQDYIIDKWKWVDLTSLGTVVGLELSISSSDVGAFGVNTPSYFALDALNGIYPSGSISGRITADVLGYNAPVQGAWVTLSGMGKTVQTDVNGEYRFDSLSADTYEMQVKANNFGTKAIQNVQVTEGTNTEVPDSDGLLSLLALPQVIHGDANQDGAVDLRDALIILHWMSGIRTQP